jgi:hypothetical protein
MVFALFISIVSCRIQHGRLKVWTVDLDLIAERMTLCPLGRVDVILIRGIFGVTVFNYATDLQHEARSELDVVTLYTELGFWIRRHRFS